MDKEKQIEEMAKDLCALNRECETCPFQLKGIKCNPKHNAERFIAKGYRKQSEGEWITEGDELRNTTCSVCGHWVETPYGKTPCCPNCGAKMKGGE